MADNKKPENKQGTKNVKPRATKAPAKGAKVPAREPAWNAETWMSMSNARLGKPAFVMAGALAGQPPKAVFTEAQVRALLKKFLEQSL